MFLADVLGTVVSPVQHPVLEGERLLLLRPLAPDGRPDGLTRIGIDRAQAGEGDRVLVVDEGNSGRQLLGAPNGPVKMDPRMPRRAVCSRWRARRIDGFSRCGDGGGGGGGGMLMLGDLPIGVLLRLRRTGRSRSLLVSPRSCPRDRAAPPGMRT